MDEIRAQMLVFEQDQRIENLIYLKNAKLKEIYGLRAYKQEK